MTVTKVIRYKTRPESADENERLIRDVFPELAEQRPPGLHYAAFRLEDGVSFVHVAVIDGATNPLSTTPIGQLHSNFACTTNPFALTGGAKRTLSWTLKYADPA